MDLNKSFNIKFIYLVRILFTHLVLKKFIMKKIIVIVAMLSVSLSVFACKNKKKATSTATSGANAPESNSNGSAQGKVRAYRFIVSFISIGSGSDATAMSKLEKIVKEYSGKASFEVVSWGREGEKDYCFSLNEMNSSDQTKFIERVKKELANNNLVQFRENGPAKGVRE